MRLGGICLCARPINHLSAALICQSFHLTTTLVLRELLKQRATESKAAADRASPAALWVSMFSATHSEQDDLKQMRCVFKLKQI